MDTKLLLIVAVVLYALAALFMRHTHPYSGSRSEKFEDKQMRRRIGLFLISAASLLVGIVVLTQMLVSRN